MDSTVVYVVGSIATTAVAALVGLVAWIGRTIARGNWVPRKTHEDALKTIETQREHIRLQDDREDGVILEMGKTLDAMLRAVQSQTREAP